MEDPRIGTPEWFERSARASKARSEREFQSNIATWGLFVAAGLALFCLVATWAHGAAYFGQMRWIVPVLALALSVIALRVKLGGWLLGLVPVVVLWNPVAPIYLSRSAWLPLDLAAVGLSVAIIVALFKRSTKLLEERSEVVG